MDSRLRNGGNKRHSGVFDQPIPSLRRRTSKRAQSSDRHGQVYTEDFAPGTIRTVTPDAAPETASPFGSPGAASGTTASPAVPGAPPRQSSRDHTNTNTNVGREKIPPGAGSDSMSRPRTRTMEEVVRDRSPNSLGTKNRHRLGSVNALSPTSTSKLDESSSIGFPSIISSKQQTTQSRQKLVKSPPRPLSPATEWVSVPNSTVPSPASTDTARVLQLMKTTCGRMQGILSFRTAKSSSWNSGYCAINVASGSLIYQMKGDVSHTKTLISDLRGCKVRTQVDGEEMPSYLEISTQPLGACVHLRPHVPETFDSWLAALLCWQPLRSREGHNRKPVQQTYAKSQRNSDRRRSSINMLRDATIIKVGKMLYWDHNATDSNPNSSIRVSTYKQLRSASGLPWRKISCTLQENGLLKLYLESDTSLLHIIPLSSLTRCAIQRLHPTVLEDEYCIAIYSQYSAASAEPLDIKHPIYLSLESRVLFEVWYVLLRAFAVPELYGPEQPSLRASVDLSVAEKQQIFDFDNLFRVEKLLSLRIIEAKVHSPEASTDSPKKSGKAKNAQTHDWVSGDYHAEVLLDGELRGKTATKSNTSNPFWREDYDFADLPAVLSNVSVVVKTTSLGQRDWTSISDDRFDRNGDVDILGKVGDVRVAPLDMSIGAVTLPLEEVEKNREYEQWWPITNELGESVGEVLMKLRIDEVIVLMSNHYEPVSNLLHSFSNGLTQQITAAYPGDGRKLHETLLSIFQYSGRASDWVVSLIEDEIDGLHKDLPAPRYRYSRRIASNDSYDSGVEREMFLRDMGKNAHQEANLLFRGNSLLTKSLDFHMRRLGKEYLEETLGERIRDIDESDPECEVDPNRVRNKEDLQRNWRNLIALTESVWMSIKASPSRCPPELRGIFRHVRACAEDRYGDFLRTVRYSSVSGFLFLRFLCPAVLNPKLFGLLKDHPRSRAIRTLTLIAKSLQCLANLSTFGSKEPWMEPMNAFINSHRSEFKSYIDAICLIPTDASVSRIPPSYTTPITIFSRLPQTSKEGFASLPYLIDHARELATLTNLWIEASSGKSDPGDSEDLVTFNNLCLALRNQTKTTVSRAMQADRPTSDLQSNWVEILENFNRQTRLSDHESGRTSPTKTAPSSTNTVSGPVAAITRVARRFKGQSIAIGNNSAISLSSPQSSSTGPSPHRSHSPFQHGTFTDQPSPFVPSPPLQESMSASSVWDPGTDNRFPQHALAWDDDEPGSGGAAARAPEYAAIERTDSFGYASDIRGPLGSHRHLASLETSTRGGQAVKNGTNLAENAAVTTTGNGESERSPVSPREGRRLVDIWGLRKKDRDKDGQRERDKGGGGTGSGASEAGRSDGEGKGRTLTKAQRGGQREGGGKGKRRDR